MSTDILLCRFVKIDWNCSEDNNSHDSVNLRFMQNNLIPSSLHQWWSCVCVSNYTVYVMFVCTALNVRGCAKLWWKLEGILQDSTVKCLLVFPSCMHAHSDWDTHTGLAGVSVWNWMFEIWQVEVFTYNPVQQAEDTAPALQICACVCVSEDKLLVPFGLLHF